MPGGDGDRTDTSTRPPTPPIPEPEPEPEPCLTDRCTVLYEVVSPPEVTLADLASFRPAAPTLDGEPAGFGVVGMPTNVMATASEQRMAGTILGWDVTVRFVPAGFVLRLRRRRHRPLCRRRRELAAPRTGAVHPYGHEPRLP